MVRRGQMAGTTGTNRCDICQKVLYIHEPFKPREKSMTLYVRENKAVALLQTIVLTLTVLLVSPAVMALDLTLGASYVSKNLTEEAWNDAANQTGFGLDATFIPPIIPFLEVIAGITSQNSKFKRGTSEVKIKSTDTYVGVGAGYTFLGLVRPSIGLGAISSSTNVTTAGSSTKTSSSGSGLWYGASLRVHFLSSFFAQLRLINTFISTEDFGKHADLNAQMGILTFGYSFL